MIAALPVAGGMWAYAKETGADRPNILWLTIEDTSDYEFGCYGNEHVKTPNIDALAQRGALFTNASSVAPQCSPARSTLISGAYATTYGTDVHRKHYRVPADQYFYPLLFEEAGYYRLNPGKTDYNTKRPEGLWDEGENYT
ncbi:MAG: sulfatase-like hydrolase/transferase, partial [Verrucomicrobiota bacterium]